MIRFIKKIIKDFQTPPEAVRSVTIKPTLINHWPPWEETQKIVQAALSRSRDV